MLARSIEWAVQEEGEILGNHAKFHILLSDGRAGENLQGGCQQPVVGPRMNDETCRERVAEFSRHRSEDRPLDMPIAVEERMDGLELDMGQSRLDQWRRLVGRQVEVSFERAKKVCKRFRRRRDEAVPR